MPGNTKAPLERRSMSLQREAYWDMKPNFCKFTVSLKPHIALTQNLWTCCRYRTHATPPKWLPERNQHKMVAPPTPAPSQVARAASAPSTTRAAKTRRGPRRAARPASTAAAAPSGSGSACPSTAAASTAAAACEPAFRSPQRAPAAGERTLRLPRPCFGFELLMRRGVFFCSPGKWPQPTKLPCVRASCVREAPQVRNILKPLPPSCHF